jgi:exo-1,4-beta-D-glucosaminidase
VINPAIAQISWTPLWQWVRRLPECRVPAAHGGERASKRPRVCAYRRRPRVLLALWLVVSAARAATPDRLELADGWLLQSSREVTVTPEVLSSESFRPDHWRPAKVPATVLAAQVAAGEFKDLFHADNLRKLPGMRPVSADGAPDAYDVPWWYRTEFRLPPAFRGRKVWLHCNGINSKANIWLNGKRLASSTEAAGSFRIFEFEATRLVDPDRVNVLALEVFAPGEDDFGINLVDWIPTPPDRDMGLWREVFLTASGPVRVRYPAVSTHFPDRTLERADLTVRAEVYNDSAAPVAGVLRGGFDGVQLETKVTLGPGEKRAVAFLPGEYPQLRISHPELWWPAGWGAQTLHRLSMQFEIAGVVSDAAAATFGIREVTAELHGEAARPGEVFNNNGDFTGIPTDERPFLLRVNGRPVLIRGGGWCPDMLMRSSPERIRAEFRYLLDMHLNAIRLEGKLEGDAFFDLADQMGLLVLAGWCCGDRWEHWAKWKPNDYTIAYESLRTQSLRLRHHPSVALWMNGSDNPPRADIEAKYLQILAETGWPNPTLSSATSVPTKVSGPTGVKMTGPYDYVPPAYWLLDTRHFGGAFGFNTETSPGPAIPGLGSLRRFLPPDKVWPANELWDFHAGAGNLNNNITHFRESMDAIYGPPTGLEDFLRKAQAMAYDGERAMFEAYARNKYRSTGVIQWMLNNGWPSVVWHLYDYYLQPAAGYFGTKKACEPLHIQYSYDDRGVVVVNGSNRAVPALTAGVALYDFSLRQVFAHEGRLTAAPDSVQRIVVLPADRIPPGVCFLRLTLSDEGGRAISTNFYWLPREPSTFDWSNEQARAHPYYTAVRTYEDLTMLNQLPSTRLEATAIVRTESAGEAIEVTVRNPASSLAFQIHLALVAPEMGAEILPVRWEDNYFSLLPGETRTVVARYDAGTAVARATLTVGGWNIEPQTCPVGPAPAAADASRRSGEK